MLSYGSHVRFEGVSWKGILSRAGDKLLLQLQAAKDQVIQVL